MMKNPVTRDSEDGFVLIAVLSVLALLSGMVATMLVLSRSSVDTVGLASDELRTEAMQQSAISLAGYQLFVLRAPADSVNGQQIRLDDGVVTLSVLSEADKVDLNGSSKTLLAAAYQAAGLKSLAPEAFAARVVDWRDADDDVSEDGAEASDYRASGLTWSPRNGLFRSIDDLRWVLGVSAADIKVLRPLVTTYNPRGRLDVFSTSGALLAALPGVDAETVAEVLTVRRSRTDATAAKLADMLLVQSALVDGEPPSTYRVTVDTSPERGGRPRRVEVVMAAGVTPASAYQVLRWSE